MYLCYLDESGTASIPGNTSHFILVGLSIPIWHWKKCDNEIASIKKNFYLEDSEIHTAWILRKYFEQSKIPDFESLSITDRRNSIEKYRKQELYRLEKSKNHILLRQTKKNYEKTKNYIHLTYNERVKLIETIAECISNWSFARLFAECIDKVYFNPSLSSQSVDEQALEQVVSRFEQYLKNINTTSENKCFGLLIHDNNETISKKHTLLMKKYLYSGTLWTNIDCIIETPLFVNSELTSMVQISDLCAYALRRYLENKETNLFSKIFKRADRKDIKVVGVRHFSDNNCACEICNSRKK